MIDNFDEFVVDFVRRVQEVSHSSKCYSRNYNALSKIVHFLLSLRRQKQI